MKNGLIIENGDKTWYLNGVKHREDGPAVIFKNGDQAWYINGKRHREVGPAYEGKRMTKYWYFDGKRHREDGPAVIFEDGAEHWYLNGKELWHPKHFTTMEAWLLYLNANEKYSYQWIHDIKGLLLLIDKPTDKQIRVHQMSHVL